MLNQQEKRENNISLAICLPLSLSFSIFEFKTETQYQTTMHVNNQNCADDELKKSAGEILNGIKRTVEVQVVNPSTFNFQDQTILGKSKKLRSRCLSI